MTNILISKGLILICYYQEEGKRLIKESSTLLKIKLSTLEFSDLIMLGIGAFSPLEGFITENDYTSVLEDMRLKNGILWPLPVTITVDDPESYEKGKDAALISPYSDEVVGQINIDDIAP